MAYLTFTSSEENRSSCFKFIGAGNTSSTGLISNNTSLISTNISLLSSDDNGLDTCSFYSGPSDSTIISFGETCGSVAYEGASESCGSVAYSGVGESCGSVAYSSTSSTSSSACSYSC